MRDKTAKIMKGVGLSKKAALKKYRKDKVHAEPVNQLLFDMLTEVIYEFDGELSLAAVIGIVELVKDGIKEQHSD